MIAKGAELDREDFEHFIMLHRLGIHPSKDYEGKYYPYTQDDGGSDSVYPAMVFLYDIMTLPSEWIVDIYEAEDDKQLAQLYYEYVEDDEIRLFLRMKWGFQ